jgi:hypothetical protein
MEHQFTSNHSIPMQLLVANRDTVQSRTRLLLGRDDQMRLIQRETPNTALGFRTLGFRFQQWLIGVK